MLENIFTATTIAPPKSANRITVSPETAAFSPLKLQTSEGILCQTKKNRVRGILGVCEELGY